MASCLPPSCQVVLCSPSMHPTKAGILQPKICHPPLMAKLDLADRYYRISLHLQAALNLAIVIPADTTHHKPPVATPLSLSMRWAQSTPCFCSWPNQQPIPGNHIPKQNQQRRWQEWLPLASRASNFPVSLDSVVQQAPTLLVATATSKDGMGGFGLIKILTGNAPFHPTYRNNS